MSSRSISFLHHDYFCPVSIKTCACYIFLSGHLLTLQMLVYTPLRCLQSSPDAHFLYPQISWILAGRTRGPNFLPFDNPSVRVDCGGVNATFRLQGAQRGAKGAINRVVGVSQGSLL